MPSGMDTVGRQNAYSFRIHSSLTAVLNAMPILNAIKRTPIIMMLVIIYSLLQKKINIINNSPENSIPEIPVILDILTSSNFESSSFCIPMKPGSRNIQCLTTIKRKNRDNIEKNTTIIAKLSICFHPPLANIRYGDGHGRIHTLYEIISSDKESDC